MAHPVRPDSYIEINNFYTVTIYEKGAEVVRMMQTLVGRAGFRKGMDLYFARHDGQAVTCDDFAQAIADANPGSELAMRWSRSSAGTARPVPRVAAHGVYNPDAQTYTLSFSQSCAATPDQAVKEPFVIPVSLGLVGSVSRASLPLQQEGTDTASTTHLLVLSQAQQSITFTGITEQPVPSILRGFSAPVILDCDYSDEELLTLLAHDADAFNRWEAGQRLLLRSAIKSIASAADSTGAKPPK